MNIYKFKKFLIIFIEINFYILFIIIILKKKDFNKVNLLYFTEFFNIKYNQDFIKYLFIEI
jgi:hypothetical protein